MHAFDFPTDPAFWQDPFPFYQRALAAGDGLFTLSSGGYSVLGYRAANALGRDPRVEGHPLPEGGYGPDAAHLTALLEWGLFAMGAPLHRPLRQAVIAGLSGRRVAELAQALEPDIARLAAELRARPAPDLLGDFVKPLCGLAFCRLVGAPPSMAPEIIAVIDTIGEHLAAPQDSKAAEADAAARRLLDVLDGLERSGASPLMRDMAERLPADAACGPARLVASLAFDATEMLALGIFGVFDVLLHRQGVADDIAAGRYALSAAVQEAFRLSSPAVLTSRIAAEDMVFDGHAIAAGSPLIFWWASANLDAGVYAEPLRFDPARAGPRHLAFGIGAHACLGQHLTAAVAERAVAALLLDSGRRPAFQGEIVYLPRVARMPRSAPVAFK
jgi:cytochrome P450